MELIETFHQTRPGTRARFFIQSQGLPCQRFFQSVKTFTAPTRTPTAARYSLFLSLISIVLVLSTACLPKNDLALPTVRVSPTTEEQLSAPVGSSATALLDGQRFDELEVEIQPLGRAQISQEAINHLRAFLIEHVAIAPEKIDITLNAAADISPSAENTARYDLTQIRSLERRLRRTRPILNRGSIFLLIADAPFTDDTPRRMTYALAHQNTSIVLYHPSILSAIDQPGAPERWQLEAAVIEHELGHLLGLVNLKTRGHEHSSRQSPSHCAQTGCLMSENTHLATTLARATTEDGVPRLCESCLRQLEELGANRERDHAPNAR